MRKNIITCLLLSALFCLIGNNETTGQTNDSNWVAITVPQQGISFSMPGQPLAVDTLHTKLYAVSVDSLLALQVHIFDSASLNPNETFLKAALAQTDGDTLRAIAAIFLLVTNSDLLELNDTTVNNIRSIEIGLNYKTYASNIPYISFIKYWFVNDNFFAFTITGANEDIERINSYKTIFYSSINVY